MRRVLSVVATTFLIAATLGLAAPAAMADQGGSHHSSADRSHGQSADHGKPSDKSSGWSGDHQKGGDTPAQGEPSGQPNAGDKPSGDNSTSSDKPDKGKSDDRNAYPQSPPPDKGGDKGGKGCGDKPHPTPTPTPTPTPEPVVVVHPDATVASDGCGGGGTLVDVFFDNSKSTISVGFEVVVRTKGSHGVWTTKVVDTRELAGGYSERWIFTVQGDSYVTVRGADRDLVTEFIKYACTPDTVASPPAAPKPPVAKPAVVIAAPATGMPVAQPLPATLPHTGGGSAIPYALAGLGLLGVGATLILFSRRPKAIMA